MMQAIYEVFDLANRTLEGTFIPNIPNMEDTYVFPKT